jgi:hypothetical protein
VSITLDATHHECTPLFEFMPLRFPSPTRAPLVTSEDVRSAQGPRYHGAKPAPPTRPCSPSLCCPTQSQDYMHTSGRHEPGGFAFRSGPRNATPPALCGDKSARPAACRRSSPPDNHSVQYPRNTRCSTSFFYIRVFLQRHPTFLPQQDYGDVPLSSVPPPVAQSRCGRSRCGNNYIYIYRTLSFIAKVDMYVLPTCGSPVSRAVPIP